MGGKRMKFGIILSYFYCIIFHAQQNTCKCYTYVDSLLQTTVFPRSF
jgi:hypothetical protein